MLWLITFLGVILCTLKALGLITISWWLALAPFAAALAIGISLWLLFLGTVFLGVLAGRDL